MRYPAIDRLRAVCALSVIVLHVTANYIRQYEIALVLNQLTRFCVPAFIIVSGFVLFKPDGMPQTAASWFSFLKARFFRIFPPYLLWSLVFLCYRNAFKGGVSLKTAAYDLLSGQSYLHLYFLFVLAQLYLLFPLLSGLYQKYEKATLFTAAVISLVFQTILYLSQAGAIPRLEYAYFLPSLFPPYLGYFLLGIHLRRHYAKISEALPHFRFRLSFLWMISFLALFFDGMKTNTYGLSVKPSVIPYAVLTVLCLLLHFNRNSHKETRHRRFSQWVSDQSFCIYFVHPLIISALYQIIDRLGTPSFFIQPRGILFLFALICGLSFLFAGIVSLSRFAFIFGGVARRRRL